ncbi:hypothetical protein OC846_002476 [Tilletia horrida]|uniref:3-hydroxyacyl-CoA dehydrogenase n=1 Tax=Tilletia horrida TaxID=155126 RepID=A0AAN6GU12_9BASI|nr:hypothetical protein OC846_002476 [Tilletia horrida]KAK0568216.1 hypothetical protein OC861_002159 [Tilletia horrida]
MRVSDHIWYITGGASGLGQATARLLHGLGGYISIWDIDGEGARSLAAELDASHETSKGKGKKQRGPSRVAAFIVDVCDEGGIQSAIEGTDKLWPKLPIGGVINCGGVAMAGKTLNPEGEPFDLDTFRRVVEINLIGTFNVSRLVASRLIRDLPKPVQKAGEKTPDRGVIINTASAAALEGQMGQVSYAASKAGVLGMGLPMARDLAWYGIRVMTLCPALFETPMTQNLPQRARQSLLKNAEFPARFGQPNEFAHAVLSIIENEMMNGSYIRLDGATRLGKL